MLTVNQFVNQYSQFQGLGTYLGSDFEFRFNDRFYIAASGKTGFNVGEVRDSVEDTIFRIPDFELQILSGNVIFGVSNFLGSPAFETSNITRNPIRVVPSFEGRIGAGVTTKPSCSGFIFGAEIAYEYHQFFNALDRLSGITPLSFGITPLSSYRSFDVSLQGPYLELKMIF